MTDGDRSAWFRAMVSGDGPAPPAARTLGFKLTSVSPESGEAEGTFEAVAEFQNMLGGVQGGFLAAMLDVIVSCALLGSLPPGHFAPTLELKVSYLRPAPPGRLVGRGRVLHRGGTIAFLGGELFGPDGTLLSTGSATARIVRARSMVGSDGMEGPPDE
jgi:uncharacterized protein (TIGR00369 family)